MIKCKIKETPKHVYLSNLAVYLLLWKFWPDVLVQTPVHLTLMVKAVALPPHQTPFQTRRQRAHDSRAEIKCSWTTGRSWRVWRWLSSNINVFWLEEEPWRNTWVPLNNSSSSSSNHRLMSRLQAARLPSNNSTSSCPTEADSTAYPHNISMRSSLEYTSVTRESFLFISSENMKN